MVHASFDSSDANCEGANRLSDAELGAGRNQTRTASFASLLLLASVLGAERARAAGSFDIPAECGTPSEFAREVDARLPANVPRPAPDVSIARSGTGYFLKLRLGQESREFSHADCRELFRVAVVVTVAMSLSHSEAHARQPVTEAQAPTFAPSSTVSAVERGAPDRPPSSEPPPRWAFGASAAPGLSFGMAPRPAPQLELEGRALRGMFGVAVRLRYRAPRAEQDANDRGVRVTSFGGELALLARPHRLVEASLGFAADRLFGTGLGSVSERSDGAWGAGPTLGLTLVPLQRSGTWVGVGGDLHLDLVQPEFQILNYDTVFRVPLFSGSAFLRLGHVFD